MTHQNGEKLQEHNQIDNPVSGAKSRMRLPKPIGENAIFRNAVEDSIGTDDRSIDRAGQDQEADDNDKCPEKQSQQQRPPQIHGESGDEVILVDWHPHRVRNNHHEQQRCHPRKNEAVNSNDDGGPLQVLQLRMGKLAVDLGQRFLAAHGQHGMAEGNEDAEETELRGEIMGKVRVLQEA